MSVQPLAAIVSELDRAGIPHMLAGSFASTYHGDPRTTNDIDLVIDPTRDALYIFVGGLDPERFYVSAEAARMAFERRSQFNVVLLDSGWKADLIVRKERPFSRSEFDRRQPAEIAGVALFVATAEDTIVAKLEWARAGESERQLRDVVGIVEVSGERGMKMQPVVTRAQRQAPRATRVRFKGPAGIRCRASGAAPRARECRR